MKNDSVREELEASLTSGAGPVKYGFGRASAEPVECVPVPELPVEKTPVEKRVHTAGLTPKNTSPTLAEFKTPNMTIPDWRLELQNTIRQRSGRPVEIDTNAVSSLHTSGANALKPRYAAETTVENVPDPKELKVANALKRIEQSRRTYLPTEKAREGIRIAKAASKNFPFNVVSRSTDLKEINNQPAEKSVPAVRPKLVSSIKIEKKLYDTNKLAPIPEAAYMADVSEPADELNVGLKKNWSQRIEIKGSGNLAERSPITAAADEIQTDEIDDLAPISMRFNAGLFDLIIGSFATCILLSPLMAWSESWFTVSGVLLTAVVLLAVMFVYLTASITFLGRSFGMKLFSLELVDVEQSELPTLQQAAVNSFVYLFSLMLGGLGFLPIMFNEEKRAAHDLVSGTILVRV